MNKISFLCAVLSLLFFVMTSFGQQADQTDPGKSAAVKTALDKISQMAHEKQRQTPFTIITPEDLNTLSPAERNILTSPQGPCDTASPIDSGQTINGQLTSSDCQLSDGSYADFYVYNGFAGQTVTLTMNSTAFDTYLGIAGEDNSLHVEDNNGGGGTNSKILVQLPSDGYYLILANSYFASQFGDYTLSLTASCTYSLSQYVVNAPAAGGTYSVTVNTQAGCQWTAMTQYQVPYISFSSSSGTGPGSFTFTVDPNPNEFTRNGSHILVSYQTLTVNQEAKFCSYTLSPSSVSLPARPSSGSFDVATQAGCVWKAGSALDSFITHDSHDGTTGSGTVHYSVTTNDGAGRVGTITIFGGSGFSDFTINQAGLNCTFSLSSTNLSLDRFEHIGEIYVTTQPGCAWKLASPPSVIISTEDRFGSGSVIFKLLENNTNADRNTGFYIVGLNKSVNIKQTLLSYRAQPDFDTNYKADFAVFRPSNNYWYRPLWYGGFTGFELGSSNDVLVPANYENQLTTDLGIYRDGNWTIINPTGAPIMNVNFGGPGDIPVPADYDGDGKADIAVYRPSNGVWYRLNSSDGQFVANNWGAAEDKPVIGDFDGDGKADLCVYRPSNGVWYLIKSSNNEFVANGFGAAEDLTVAADYDGDGRTDIAVYRPSNNVWYRLNSRDGSFAAVSWGAGTDKPAPADYDGDGKADITVYRDGTWYIVRSSNSQIDFGYFGAAGDIPLAGVYVR